MTDHFPGMFSISLTGHVDAGESSAVALYREIREELRLEPTQMNIDFVFSYRQDIKISSEFIDRQFNDVYACWHTFKIEDILFNPEETSELKLIPFSEFNEVVITEKGYFAPVYARECADLGYFLRSRLDWPLL